MKIVHEFFSHCIHSLGFNHVNLRTRFCFKNNARRVFRSPSAGALRQYNGQTKKDNHWSTNHFPHSDIFFHRKQKSDFYFWDIKKISNFPSNFYHKFLVENWRAGLMIFLHLSCQFILFLIKISPHNYIFFFPEKDILKVK